MKRKFKRYPILAAQGNVDAIEVANNPNTPPEILAKLADGGGILIRKVVANNPNTPPEILAKLADDEDWIVRSTVARNQNTPLEILAKLSEDEYVVVRRTVANNPNYSSRNSIDEEVSDTSLKDTQDSIATVHQLNESDGEFDMFDIEESYLSELENECLDQLGLWLEPSIQGNQGGIWIYTQGDDETVLEGYDYESYVEKCIDIALDSDNEEEFKSRYTQFINSIID